MRLGQYPSALQQDAADKAQTCVHIQAFTARQQAKLNAQQAELDALAAVAPK